MKRLLKNIFLCAAIIAMTAQGLCAQKLASPEKAAQMIEEIGRNTAAMTKISCSFVQTKTISALDSKVVSKGRMSYERPSDLRWEYTEPHKYAMVMHDGIATIEKSSGKEVIDTRKNKVFQQICEIMLSSVTGDCLSDNERFSVTMMEQDGLWLAVLLPMKKEMSQFIHTMTLCYDPSQKCVTKVEMKEQTGDTTLIELNGIRYETAR